MKICHTLLCMNPGGAENVVATLSNYWVSENKEVTIVIFVGDEDPIFYKLNPNIKIYKLDLYGESKNFFQSLKKFIKIIQSLIKIYSEIKPNIILAHGNREITLSTISSIITGNKIIGYIHNDQSEYYREKSLFWRLMEKIIYPLTNNLVILDNSILNKIPIFAKNKVIQINNPVDDKYFDLKKTKKNMNIIHVGSFIKRKNQSCLIKAFSKIATKNLKSRLVLIGEGPEKKSCEDLCLKLKIKERVDFLGNIKNVKYHLKKSALFVMPSFSEGMSISLLEALASGLPIITTNFSSFHRKVTINGKNGYLVKVNDENDMAKKINLILNNDKLRANMSITSKIISKDYSIKKVSKKWDKVFKKFNYE